MYGAMFLDKGRNPATDGDQPRTVMGNSVGTEVQNVRPDRIAKRMKTAGQAAEYVFRFVLLVPDNRIFHSPYVFENEPVRLEFFQNVYSRKNQTVALVFLRTIPLSD